MADGTPQGELAADQDPVAEWELALANTVHAAGPPLLYGLRLWASVCLALFVAFWLELDNPFWAGTSAAVVCQPQLGASLRKGRFRMMGTVVGATMVVVLTALFPQDRIAYLALLALWCGLCVFVATVLRNFASYAAALAGYTAAIIAADNLGATGGASPDVFLLAVTRASEICIGIVCAGIVLAGTDLGSAQRRLAASFADLAAEIAGRFARMLTLAGRQLPDKQTERHQLIRRVIELDPVIDQVLGESSQVRYHSPTLQTAVHGLFRALDGWRGVAIHLNRLPHKDRVAAQNILRSIPPELRSARDQDTPARWMADPMALCRACAEAAQTLVALPAGTPLLRLLADESAKVMGGMSRALEGLALLVDAPDRPRPARRGFQLAASDWLPPLVNAARVFVTIGAVELFWVATAWPNGASAIVFVAIVVVLLSPKGDLAYGGAVAFTLGAAGSILFAAIIKFAVLPGLETFPAFCAAIGLFLIPAGFAIARSRTPAAIAVFTAMGVYFQPLLAVTNPIIYDTELFYNTALAIFAGCAVAALSFRLLPPVSPAWRTRRVLVLALRDLRRVATAPIPPRSEDWESAMYGRFAAMPDQAEPLQRAQLLAALSVGAEIIHLRRIARRLGPAVELDAALDALAKGNSRTAIAWLHQLDNRLSSDPDRGPEAATLLRARSRILVMSEALSEHASYFDAGAFS
jgi:uncharacterized membrane protein YccC